jgi:signal transduction histidine kinase
MPGGSSGASAQRDTVQDIAERLWLAANLKVLSPKTVFSMNDAVDAALFLTDKMFKQAGVAVRRQLNPKMPHVDAAMGYVEQALVNVLVNACEAMTRGGVVSVETHYAPAANALQVRVKDTGAGIPAEEMEKVFDPFYGTKGHMGLGLTAARDLVRQCGGDIRIESRSGAGTTVFLIFPARA